jgi:uncharacterized protein YndB with AHSA1/START domain
VAAPTEKDVETMPTQKLFKQRVRARMTKTGESYTTARQQLLRKAVGPQAIEPEGTTEVSTPEQAAASAVVTEPIPPDARLVADASMLRATGKGHAEWFGLLDAWGGTEHNHTEIARWLSETHGVPGWWTQNITVAYERARGLRARHQMRDGFSISVTRTVSAAPERALEAFTDAAVRARWLPQAPMTQRPTRAKLAARFDWADPPSRVIVAIVPKGTDRAVVAVAHEQVPDAETGELLKRRWRESLGDLKAVLEQR